MRVEVGALGARDGECRTVGTGSEGLGLGVRDAEVDREGREQHQGNEEEGHDQRDTTSLLAARCAAAAELAHQVYSHWKFPFDPRSSVP